MNNLEKRFFNIAKEVSYLSTFHRCHVGAVVVEGRRVISTGLNSERQTPLQERYNKYRNFDSKKYPACEHAEVNAIGRIIDKRDVDWTNVSIYTYREANGKRSCSRPCKACEKLIKDLGIKTVYYTDWNGNYIKERVL